MVDYLQEDGLMTLFEHAFYIETCNEHSGNNMMTVINKLKNFKILKKYVLFLIFIFNY